MEDHQITFVIFTYNEAGRIERVIKNFKNYGKILIADNKSTDKTVEIARVYGCKVYLRQKEYVFVENQELVNELYKHITTEWVYWAFADEMLDKETLLLMIQAIKSNKYDIINIDRKNYSEGQFCYNVFHTRTNKAFKKNAIDFTHNVIHGMGSPTVPNNRICKMPDKNFIHHFTSHTVSDVIKTIDRYTEAELENSETPKQSLSYMLWQITKRIIKNYIVEKGYKAKYAGLQTVQTFILYEWVKNIKLYEHINQLNRKTIEDRYDIYRDNILKQLEQ